MNAPAPTSTPALPWYRHPWVWFIIALPALSVVGGLSLLAVSITHQDDLVRDDWYKAGRAINQDLQAENRARELGLAATLVLDPAAPSVRIEITGAAGLPSRLSLSLVHSTLASEDMTVFPERIEPGIWQAALPRLPLGKRHLMLEPVVDAGQGVPPENYRWRLRAGDVLFQGDPVRLSPRG